LGFAVFSCGGLSFARARPPQGPAHNVSDRNVVIQILFIVSLNFVFRFPASAIRVNSIALGLTKRFVFSIGSVVFGRKSGDAFGSDTAKIAHRHFRSVIRITDCLTIITVVA